MNNKLSIVRGKSRLQILRPVRVKWFSPLTFPLCFEHNSGSAYVELFTFGQRFER
jgi:hypothetical protein